VWVASSTKLALTPTAVALGKFDGVHLGHQKVIQPVLQSVGNEEGWGDGEKLLPTAPCCPLPQFLMAKPPI